MGLTSSQQNTAIICIVLQYLTLQAHCAPGLSEGSRNINCSSDIVHSYNNCTNTEYWNFKFLGDKSLNLKTVFCGSDKILGCQNITTAFRNKGCDEKHTNDKGSNIPTKQAFFQSLCTVEKQSGQKCLEILSVAYNLLNSRQSNGSLFKFPGNMIQPISCCLQLIHNSYNLSKTALAKMSQMIIKQLGHPLDKACLIQVQPATEQVAPTSGKPSSTESKITKPKKTFKFLQKMSNRLIAGLVIASIIFLVVAYIVGRFVYQRIQRKKRAKYEDYGYSQLKVILDDALDEEEDDDQLISAT